MRFRFTLIVVALFLLAIMQPILAQPAGDKTGDKKGEPKKDKDKEPEKITEKTEINGKILKAWIDLIPSKDRSVTEVAIKTIMLYGPDIAKKAVPALIEELEKHNKPDPIDLSVRVNGCIALGMILGSLKEPDTVQVNKAVKLFKKMLADTQVIVRFRAAQSVAQLGPMARDVVPELETLVKDFATWETRHAAVIALGSVAWDAKKPPDAGVLKALYGRLLYSAKGTPLESCVKIRMSAMQALAYLRADGGDAAAVAELHKKLDDVWQTDPDPFCKLRAHMMVWALLTDKEKAKRAPTIAKFFDNKDVSVKAEVMQAVSFIKDEDRVNFITPLAKVAKDDTDPMFRLHAHVLLFRTYKKPIDKKSSLDAVLKFLGDEKIELRVEAAQAVGHLGKDAKDAIPTLMKSVEKCLESKDYHVMGMCAWALGEMEQTASAAVPFLNKIVEDKTIPEEYREVVKEAVKHITEGKKKPEEPKKKSDK
jgi:HEAT repeat protein